MAHCKQCGETDESKLQRRKNRKGVYVLRNRCVPCGTQQHHAWQATTNGGYARYRQKMWRALRERILLMYGHACVCCGETRLEFLGIDHIEGKGRQHRKSLGGQTQFYMWLAETRREGFRVLCHNCNLARGFYGYCPHERELPVMDNQRTDTVDVTHWGKWPMPPDIVEILGLQ